MLSSFLKTNKYIFKCSPTKYMVYVLLNVMSVVETVVVLKSMEFITNAVYRLFTKTSKGFNREMNVIILYGLALALLYSASILRQLLLKKITLEISFRFEKDLNSKLSTILWDYYEKHETSVKIYEVRTKSLSSMLSLIDSSMFYITTFIYIFVYGFFLSQINFFAVIVYLTLVVSSIKVSDRVFNEVRDIWDKIQPYSQKQNYFFGISGNKTEHQEYRFNRMFNFVSSRWEKYFDEEYKLRLKIFKKYEITLQTARIILNTPYILMMIYVSYEIVIGRYEIGFLILCQSMFNNIVNTFGGVQDCINKDKIETKFTKSFFDILDLKDEEKRFNDETIKGNISFSNVVYSYPQSKAKALDNFNFEINQGEKIAIVGHNGSGKTTFTNLLMALTKNFDGNIEADKNSDNVFSLLRNSISCILQDFSQYQMTIRENIEIGNIEYKFSDNEIIDFLDKVGLKEYVLSLSNGIDTRLGQLEEGIELSKGQWQRMAIARLLTNDKATVWILDEPTAYLDPISEIEIYDLIYRLAGSRTVFFISHRLGFAKKADRIVVFENGRIIEEGTHHHLMNLDGEYAKMYKNQESWYVA
ncbi:ATP-binding cassette domain-containing protein [Clostridium swellfunianum]|uniref:ABC transporter ATP-binding protein n=1 Tax=Clostridium swellfunianum TaxID=1367462 RepID=UPI0020306D0C|nr:ATP-binding cassette domain-containing protein [Clostridium swellfunianum]MCM0647727.1 ATP-binding cassette domain-containing protein [Clostridium swellfunianum]